jgi:DSF synthase
MQGVYRARKIFHPIVRSELDAIAEVWVDAALRLEERDLKMMHWLVRGQQRRIEPQAAPAELPRIGANDSVVVAAARV